MRGLFFNISLLLLRLVLGLIFLGHGEQKLFGFFGGHGIAGTSQFLTSLGFRPAKWWAVVVALGEFLGGLFLALGILTPLAALCIIGAMLVAIVKVHWSKGFWNMQGGIEFPLTLLVIAAALGLAGPGAYSLDAAFGINFPEPYTFLTGFIALLALLFITIPLSAWMDEHFHIPHRVPSSS